MKTHNLNPFIPPKPDDVREFMEGVQPLAPPIHRQIMETGKQIARATGMTIATVITSPVAIVEAGLYAGANVAGSVSAGFNKVASITNHGRTRIFNTVQGKTTQAA